jgi:hypothetical protein
MNRQHSSSYYRGCGSLRKRRNMIALPGLLAHVQGFLRRNVYSTRNYQLLDRESTGGIVIWQGITSSWGRNPYEEWDSAGNHQIIDCYLDPNDQNAWQILQTVTIPGSVIQILYTANVNFFKI